MKQFFLSIIRDERKGIAAFFIRGTLYLLSFVYGTAIKLIDWAYRVKIKPRHKINVPVISVGNITLGGTGKTPFTIFLADYLLSSGRKCAVLTRGYGRDECLMLKEKLEDAAIFVGQDRVRNAQVAVSRGSDVVLLDDAFQHRRIKRDLDILLLDGREPFGNGFLFPRGTLREGVRAAERADIFVLTKTDRLQASQIKNVVGMLKKIDPQKPIVKTRHRISFLTDVAGAAYAPEELKGQGAFLVSGIADPDYFAFLLLRERANIVLRHDYPDHYSYTEKDIAKIAKEALRKDIEKIITTRKDYVKIKQLDISAIENKLFILDVVIDIVEGKDELLDRLNRVVSG